MRRVFVASVSLLFSACGVPDFLQTPGGVETPTSAKVGAYLSDTVDGASIGASAHGRSRMTAGQYVLASFSYTNEKCHEFFISLERLKEDSSLIDQVITAATVASGPLAAFGGSAKAVAGLTTGLTFGNSVNKSIAQIYAISHYAKGLRTHIFDLMGSYQRARGSDQLINAQMGITSPRVQASVSCRSGSSPIAVAGVNATGGAETNYYCLNPVMGMRFFNSTAPEDLVVARGIAANYAAICSIAQMQVIVENAVNGSETRDKPAAEGTMTSTSAPAVATTTGKQ